jgi:hypothetical protein
MTRSLALTFATLIGCAGAVPAPAELPAEAHFTASDEHFKISPRARPSVVLLEETELQMTPVFKAVGVLEMTGKETRPLEEFYQAAAAAGAMVGCDVIYQRDAFEMGARVNRAMAPANGKLIAWSGRTWRRSNWIEWQFFCGINGASEPEQDQSLKMATRLAVELRRKALSFYEPCDPFTPIGSHIRHTDVCANDPKQRNVASGGSIQSFAQ